MRRIVRDGSPLLLLHLNAADAATFEKPEASFTVEVDGFRYLGASVIWRENLPDGRVSLTFNYAARVALSVLH